MSRDRAGRSERLRGAPYDESAPTFRPGLEAPSGQIAWFTFQFENRHSKPWRAVCPVPTALANRIWLNSYKKRMI